MNEANFNFTDLYKKIQAIEEGANVEECGGMMSIGGPSQPPKQSDSVTMNVSMNGSGAGGIRDLMGILKNIEQGDSSHDDDKGHDALFGDDYENSVEGGSEPEVYGIDAITQTGNDLASKGKEAPKVNGGGNPMQESLKAKLHQLYNEIKLREDGGYDAMGNPTTSAPSASPTAVAKAAPPAQAAKPRVKATPDPAVMARQKELIAAGAKIKADGIMGPATQAAEQQFGGQAAVMAANAKDAAAAGGAAAGAAAPAATNAASLKAAQDQAAGNTPANPAAQAGAAAGGAAGATTPTPAPTTGATGAAAALSGGAAAPAAAPAAPPAKPAGAPNPWEGKDPAKAAAWAALSPADQQWLGMADPTDKIILARAPSNGGFLGSLGFGKKKAAAPAAAPTPAPTTGATGAAAALSGGAAAPAAPAAAPAPSNQGSAAGYAPAPTASSGTGLKMPAAMESAELQAMLRIAGLR